MASTRHSNGHHPSSTHTHLLPQLSSSCQWLFVLPGTSLQSSLSMPGHRRVSSLYSPHLICPLVIPWASQGCPQEAVLASSARLWLHRGQDQPWQAAQTILLRWLLKTKEMQMNGVTLNPSSSFSLLRSQLQERALPEMRYCVQRPWRSYSNAQRLSFLLSKIGALKIQ